MLLPAKWPIIISGVIIAGARRFGAVVLLPRTARKAPRRRVRVAAQPLRSVRGVLRGGSGSRGGAAAAGPGATDSADDVTGIRVNM